MKRPKIEISIDPENIENAKAVINGIDITRATFLVIEFSGGEWRWMAGNEKAKTIQDYIDEHWQAGAK